MAHGVTCCDGMLREDTSAREATTGSKACRRGRADSTASTVAANLAGAIATATANAADDDVTNVAGGRGCDGGGD